MSTSTFTALGIDVGGTKIAAGLVTFPDGHVSLRREIPTRPERGGDKVLDDVLQLATELTTEAGQRNFQVNGIGLGVCELVSNAGEIVSANCLSWRSADVREGLAILAPSVIEADVRAAALAEALLENRDAKNSLTYSMKAAESFSLRQRPESQWRALITAGRASALTSDAQGQAERYQRAQQILSTLKSRWGADAFKTYSARKDIQRRQSYLPPS